MSRQDQVKEYIIKSNTWVSVQDIGTAVGIKGGWLSELIGSLEFMLDIKKTDGGKLLYKFNKDKLKQREIYDTMFNRFTRKGKGISELQSKPLRIGYEYRD